MAVYPLRTALRTLIDLVIALAVVLLVAGFCRGFTNGPILLCMAAGVVLLLVFGWGLATLAGYIHTVFRDTRHISEVGLQALFYLTPIVYPPELLLGTRMAWVVYCNPLVHFLNLIRQPLLEGMVSMKSLAAAASVTLLTAGFALALLRHLQRRLILYL
jgi:ABC-type polysaccharide/polyol phosphate export permease